jgi:hypothetical protein
MRRAHEYTINRTRLHTEGTEHALRIVDRITRYSKPLTVLHTLLANIDAVHWADLCTLVTGDARCQIKPVKSPVTRGYRNGLLGVLEALRESTPIRAIRDQPIAKRDPHAASHSAYGNAYISQPTDHLVPLSGHSS